MKLIDRYLLRSLMTPLLYTLGAFVIIIIIHDLFDNLSDFLEANTSVKDVLLFYAMLLPSVMILIIPVALLLSVLYSLLQLTKNNELTAMRASGISLYRLMSPFLTVGMSLTLLVAVIHETIGPRCAYWSHVFLQTQKHAEAAHIAENLPYYNPAGRRDWFIEQFNTKTFEMKNVKVTKERPDGTAELKVRASVGRWLDGRWWFSDVAIQEFDEQGYPKRQFDAQGNAIGAVRYERDLEMVDFDERPIDFVNVTKDPEFLTSLELVNFIHSHKHMSKDAIARVKVDLHSRLAMPWMALVATLIGIPFGSQTARKGAFTGVILSMGIFFGFYFLINIGLWMGKELMIPAWLAGWFPDLLFLGIGSVMLYRMR